MSEYTLVSLQCEETWEIRHRVLWPNQSFDFVKLPLDGDGLHFGLRLRDGTLVSIVSAFLDLPKNEMQFRKLATLQSYQGNGYGSILLRYLFNMATEMNIARVWCNARTEASTFYVRFGMVETSETSLKEGKEFVIMERILRSETSPSSS